MLTAEPLAAEEIHIWQATLDVGSDQAERCPELLSEDERARAARFHFERDRVRYIAGRAQLRMLLAEYVDAEPEELAFRYGENGKPALATPARTSTSRTPARSLCSRSPPTRRSASTSSCTTQTSAVSAFRSVSSRPMRCARCGRFQRIFSRADSWSCGLARKLSSRPAETVFRLRWTAFPLRLARIGRASFAPVGLKASRTSGVCSTSRTRMANSSQRSLRRLRDGAWFVIAPAHSRATGSNKEGAVNGSRKHDRWRPASDAQARRERGAREHRVLARARGCVPSW